MKATIREAGLEDVPRIVEMAKHFIDASGYRDVLVYDDARIEVMVRMIIEHLGVVLVAELPGHDGLIGMIGLAVIEHPFGLDRVCEEIAWWVEVSRRTGRAGPALLDAAEAWALQKSCSVIQMVAPNGSGVGRHYARRGYVPLETAWIKGLGDNGTRRHVEEDGLAKRGN